ncbi:MAG: Type 1 glutamine amidotransferase-like domain-containing protein, partial [Nanoarchaeota archaeon]|nr:Type 1 glutamine amidotransferase-like domain-containing protein [Nanoarchaeota archaeon]
MIIMKLLLTSHGICNKSMEKVLRNWVKGEIITAFIPTAANFTDGDKKWLVDNYVECQKLGTLYIADIAAVDKSVWLPRLKKANVIVVGGGNSEQLMNHIVKSGLIDEFSELLKDRVYVGISAGSMVASKKLYSTSKFLFGKESKEPPYGLGFVDFNIRPHYNSEKHTDFKDEYLKEAMANIKGDLYALDDNSAVVVENGKIKVISEGTWKLYKH